MTQKTQKIIGIYHKDCLDGTTAAAVLFKKFPNTIFFPLGRDYKVQDLEPVFSRADKDTDVYIVDFALRGDGEIERLANVSRRVITIDHHASDTERLTALSQTLPNFEFVFDNRHSGASLAWMYFFKDEPMPELVVLVEDGDIGKWEFKDKTTWSGGYLIPLLNQPDKICASFDMPIDDILERGKIVSNFIEYLIDLYVKRSEHILIKIGAHTVVAYNATFNSERIRSMLGFILMEKHNATVALFRIKGNAVSFSFRGLPDIEPSAGELAETLGGGGHRNAAGASVSLKKFCDMIIHPARN